MFQINVHLQLRGKFPCQCLLIIDIVIHYSSSIYRSLQTMEWLQTAARNTSPLFVCFINRRTYECSYCDYFLGSLNQRKFLIRSFFPETLVNWQNMLRRKHYKMIKNFHFLSKQGEDFNFYCKASSLSHWR